eukprot:TRINITY_DN9174_c0_g1_i2.p1 TRINITY_DN9174_c0_g1~~TRINITY_DN9174_c0_g1_i2.p1  ORF type:complete len:115 (-),score=31.13 TRINITY_DN9174_c0_g1_i2:90-434(-)
MLFFFFFFKQKTAYEMLRSLVGSEMCIRDRYCESAHMRGDIVCGMMGVDRLFHRGRAAFHRFIKKAYCSRLLVGLAALGTLAAGRGGSVAAVAAASVADLRVAELAAVVAGGAA